MPDTEFTMEDIARIEVLVEVTESEFERVWELSGDREE